MDAALAKIDDFLKQEQKKAGDGQPKVVVKPARESSRPCLSRRRICEIKGDIDAFLDALRRELEAAYARGERIEIR